MDEARAKELIGNFIQPDDLLLGSHDGIDQRSAEWADGGGVTLRGAFGADELEAFAWWMRNKRYAGRDAPK